MLPSGVPLVAPTSAGVCLASGFEETHVVEAHHSSIPTS